MVGYVHVWTLGLSYNIYLPLLCFNISYPITSKKRTCRPTPASAGVGRHAKHQGLIRQFCRTLHELFYDCPAKFYPSEVHIYGHWFCVDFVRCFPESNNARHLLFCCDGFVLFVLFCLLLSVVIFHYFCFVFFCFCYLVCFLLVLPDALQYETPGSTWSRPTFSGSMTARAQDIEKRAKPVRDGSGGLRWRSSMVRYWLAGVEFIKQVKSFTLVYCGATDEDIWIGSDKKAECKVRKQLARSLQGL